MYIYILGLKGFSTVQAETIRYKKLIKEINQRNEYVYYNGQGCESET